MNYDLLWLVLSPLAYLWLVLSPPTHPTVGVTYAWCYLWLVLSPPTHPAVGVITDRLPAAGVFTTRSK